MDNIILLGATSGIALELGRIFAQNGSHLILAGRDMTELTKMANDLQIRYNVKAIGKHFEALDYADHDRFFAECLAEFQHIDGVVACYGILGSQGEAESSFAEARKIIDLNFISYVSILDIVANYMEQQNKGFICAISSVAGDRGRQSNYYYGAAKGALSLYLQGLRNRLYRSGVHVVTVKPGFVDTKMTFGQQGMFLVAKPEKVAKDIHQAILKSRDVLYTPYFWRFIMMIIKTIPEKIFKRLKL